MKRKIAFFTIIILVSFLIANQATEQKLVVGQLPTRISMGVETNTTTQLPTLNYREQTLEVQKSFWAFLNQVAGINTNTYNVTRFNISPTQAPGSQKTQMAISATLKQDSEKISISMVVTEGKITFYKLDLISGSLQGSQLEVDDVLAKAKNAITTYKVNFNAVYCNGLDQLVPSSMETNNLTIDSENSLLNVELSTDQKNSLNFAHLVWYAKIVGYKVNSQSIQVEVAKTGILTSFIDNLGLYTLVTNNIAITRDEAINIAKQSIEPFAAANGLRLKSVKSQLWYVPDINGTRGDCFLIYPLWQISAKFDEPQNAVYGYSVYLWADSGKVRNQEVDSHEYVLETLTSNQSLAIIAGIVAFGLAIGIICTKRAGKLKGKHGIFKFGATAFLISLSFSLMAVQQALAYPFPSSIYGERANPPGQFPR